MCSFLVLVLLKICGDSKAYFVNNSKWKTMIVYFVLTVFNLFWVNFVRNNFSKINTVRYTNILVINKQENFHNHIIKIC